MKMDPLPNEPFNGIMMFDKKKALSFGRGRFNCLFTQDHRDAYPRYHLGLSYRAFHLWMRQ